jgi:hypothetical protein
MGCKGNYIYVTMSYGGTFRVLYQCASFAAVLVVVYVIIVGVVVVAVHGITIHLHCLLRSVLSALLQYTYISTYMFMRTNASISGAILELVL